MKYLKLLLQVTFIPLLFFIAFYTHNQGYTVVTCDYYIDSELVTFYLIDTPRPYYIDEGTITLFYKNNVTQLIDVTRFEEKCTRTIVPYKTSF